MDYCYTLFYYFISGFFMGFVLDDVSVKVYGINDYYRLDVSLLFPFGFIISDDINLTVDGNDVCISLSVYVPSEACSMELCFKVSVSGDLCGYRAYLSYLNESSSFVICLHREVDLIPPLLSDYLIDSETTI